MKTVSSLFILILLGCLLLSGSCKKNEAINNPTNSIKYKLDGRTVKLGDPLPIAIDLSGDGQVDFTIFVELTANSQGDRLFAGMNPIGANLIKSGPPIDANFLNMGLLVAESPGATIDSSVIQDQQWTPDFGALTIKKTSTNGEVSYEGNWADSEQIVGIQNKINQSTYFGWLRIKFDKLTEVVALIDYAYDSIPSRPIKAGARSN